MAKKQTSQKISKIAAKYIHLQPSELYHLACKWVDTDGKGSDKFCSEIRAMAASCLSQDEKKE